MPEELLFCDSFDHYSIDQLYRKWNQPGVLAAMAIVPGRTGSAISISAGGGGRLQTTFGGPGFHTIAAGCAYRCDAFNNTIIQFLTVVTGQTISLAHVGDGRVKATFSGGGGESVYSTFTMSLNTYYYFEFYINILANGVQFVARANEQTIISGTQTYVPTDQVVSSLNIGAPGGGNGCVVDDLYCSRGTLYGDIRVGVIFPNGPGQYSQWARVGAATNWQAINEHIPDDDGSYVHTQTIGQRELHDMDNIDPNQVIFGIQSLVLARKDLPGTGTIKPSFSIGAVPPTDTTEFFPSAEDYLYDRETHDNNVQTGDPWTVADINALQFGFIKVS